MKTLGSIALALLLVGCAQYRWEKPGATQQDFKTDAYDCEKDMRQSGYYGTGLVGALNAMDFEERCMGAHGYTKVRVQ